MAMRTGNVLAAPRNRVYAANPNSARILEVWNLATMAEIEEGMFWYRDARAFAETLDPENPARAAGVIAALSPMKDWPTNCLLAARAYEDGRASGSLGANNAKATLILHGADPLEVLGGNKVRNFYRSIADPDDASAVCIDRHAFDIAVGRITNDQSRTALSRKGVYESFGRAYERAARAIGTVTATDAEDAATGVVLASQVQAVTWVTWRRLKGII